MEVKTETEILLRIAALSSMFLFVYTLNFPIAEQPSTPETYNIDNYTIKVYENMDIKEMNERRDTDFSHLLEAFTDFDKNIWFNMDNIESRKDFNHTCVHEVLHNEYPYKDHDWIYDNEDNFQYSVCDKLVEKHS